MGDETVEGRVREALRREGGAPAVAAPDVDRLVRDAGRRGSRLPARVLAIAACLVLVGIALVTVRLLDRDPVALGGSPQTVLTEPALPGPGGDPAMGLGPCQAAAEEIADFLQAFLLTVDPITGESDESVTGDLSERIAEASARYGCAEEEVRIQTYEILLPRLLATYGQEWVTARQTLLTGIVVALNPDEFGLGGPLPTAQPRPSGPTSAPTPTTGSEGGVAWCGTRGLIGAVVTTAGSLQAMCTDGGRVPIDQGPGWTSVDIGALRLVAVQTDPQTGESSFVEYAIQGGGLLGRAPGSAAALSPGDRLAWVQVDGTVVADGSTAAYVAVDEPVTDVSWDRDSDWLFAVTSAGVLRALETADLLQSAGPLDVPGLLASTGEIDTPDTAVLLVDRNGQVAVDAVAVPGEGTAFGQPFGVASTLLPSTTFGSSSFVEAAGLLRPGPVGGGWLDGTSIGWVVGDGTTAWYVDGLSDPVVLGEDIRHLALLPR